MKYEDYETIANGVTAENALEIVTALLDRARTDAVDTDAEKADLAGQIDELKTKYNDLQVEYIKKFTSSSAEGEDDDPEADEKATEEEIEKILGGI